MAQKTKLLKESHEAKLNILDTIEGIGACRLSKITVQLFLKSAF